MSVCSELLCAMRECMSRVAADSDQLDTEIEKLLASTLCLGGEESKREIGEIEEK